MNQAAADALVAAATRGVRQIKGMLYGARGGRCQGGVIIEALFGTIGRWGLTIAEIAERAGMRETVDCPHACGVRDREWSVAVHMNNDHGDDFLTIARKLGP